MSEESNIPISGQHSTRSGDSDRISSPTTSSLSSSTMSPPRSGRKRTNDEIYPNKSGTNHSKKFSMNQRPKTAPEQNQKSFPSSDQHGSSKDQIDQAAQSFGSTVATLSTQASNVSTVITIPDAPRTFVAQLQDLRTQLDQEHEDYEKELEDRDPKAILEDFDWGRLEARYLEDMDAAIRNEQDIHMNLAKRYSHMLLWMQTSSDREAQRAIKRLRTRIAMVQTSEEKYAQKEAHYQRVLNAFQSTMALLGGP